MYARSRLASEFALWIAAFDRPFAHKSLAHSNSSSRLVQDSSSLSLFQLSWIVWYAWFLKVNTCTHIIKIKAPLFFACLYQRTKTRGRPLASFWRYCCARSSLFDFRADVRAFLENSKAYLGVPILSKNRIWFLYKKSLVLFKTLEVQPLNSSVQLSKDHSLWGEKGGWLSHGQFLDKLVMI